ncbi:hypothetical protein SRB5_44800 [Streptomyces sp. RB5]|uniref:4,5-dihydroxyphthalate decarboxylase n=1 Tax=Streptomyces smaragdinus TaxID=2585196 RepID=A0A7K0CLF5_9ACTN|nr:hypothetical protein [Streptomyces smaragdinus]MQY14316.1 hypothetical protein [Streptomyces smaragdinus]
MTALRLSMALTENPMTRPLLDGRVRVQGVELAATGLHPSELFWRQLKFGEFDISEMSLSSLSIGRSQGLRDWVAVPVFTTRRFFHTDMLARDDAGIETPADLVGKRVGVPEYQQTAAVWARVALADEFGVRASDLKWFMERPPEKSHGGATSFAPPPGVDLTYIPPDRTMGQLLASGELDAAVRYLGTTNLVDRSGRSAASIPHLRPLFADKVAEGVRYLRATGILPINHVVVIRRSLFEEHPWLALNLYAAFAEAKELVYEPLPDLIAGWARTGDVDASVVHTLRDTDPVPYGIAANKHVLERLSQALVEQGLVAERVEPLSLFAPSTHAL